MIKIRLRTVAEKKRKVDDVPPGQLYLNDVEEIVEFSQSDERNGTGGQRYDVARIYKSSPENYSV